MKIVGQKLCMLCLRQTEKFAKSHIIPKAFYNRIPAVSAKEMSERRKVTILSSEGICRTSNSGHHVDDLICPVCESKILAGYDDYAAKIYLEFRREVTRRYDSQRCSLHVFRKSVDRQKLRAFWASLLWRFSIDYHEAFGDFRLPAMWYERIRLDMISGGQFEYVDALPMSLSDFSMGAYPSPTELEVDQNLYGNGVVYKVRMPNFFAIVSLGYDVPPIVTRAFMKCMGKHCNCSLQPQYDNYGYAFAESLELPYELDAMREMYQIAIDRKA